MLTKGGTPFDVGVVVGDSISISFEVIDADGAPYDWTGATVSSGIGIGGTGWHPVTTTNGVLVLFLLGSETSALGATTHTHWVRVNKGTTVSTWLSGQLHIRQIAEPGVPSALTRTIYIVDSPTGTLRLTGCVGDADGAVINIFGGTYAAENARDDVGAALVGTGGIAITLNDSANTITIDGSAITGTGGYTDEQARDAIGAALVGTGGITITPNDVANTITINGAGSGYAAENARDDVGAALVGAGGIAITLNDGANTITVDGSAVAGSGSIDGGSAASLYGGTDVIDGEGA